MQSFRTLRQPLLGELAMSPEREREKKNAIYSGHLGLCQQPRAAHALRSDQLFFLEHWIMYFIQLSLHEKLTFSAQ